MKAKVGGLLIVLALSFFLFALPVQSLGLVNGDFYDVELQNVIRSIAEQTDTTIVMDDVVSGVVSIKFDQVPVERALAMVLSPGGYTFKKVGDYYVISTAQISNPAFKSISSTSVIKPRYIDISRINELLPSTLASYVKVDRERNLLLVTAPPAVVQRIEDIISSVDKPPAPIMVQALAVEVVREKGAQLGIDWSWQWQGGKRKLEGISVEGLAIGFTSKDTTAKVAALATEGEARILASPRVLTLEGIQTRLQLEMQKHFQLLGGGEEAPYLRFETVTTATEVNVRPYLTLEGEVMLDLRVAVEDLTRKTEAPQVTRRSVRTTVKTQSGKTIAIAGLSEEVQREMKKKVWGLGDIPVLDVLFSKKYAMDRKTELVILITPYVLKKELSSNKVALAAASWNTWKLNPQYAIGFERFSSKIYLGFSSFFGKVQDENQYKAEIGCALRYGWNLSGSYGLFEKEHYRLSFFGVKFQKEMTEIRDELYVSFSYKQREGEPQASSEEGFQQNVYSLSLKEMNSISRGLRLMGEVSLIYVEEGGKFSPAITTVSGGPVYYLGRGLSLCGRYDYIRSRQNEYQQKGYALEIEYVSYRKNWTFTAGYRDIGQENIRYMVGMEPPAKGYYASIKLFLK